MSLDNGFSSTKSSQDFSMEEESTSILAPDKGSLNLLQDGSKKEDFISMFGSTLDKFCLVFLVLSSPVFLSALFIFSHFPCESFYLIFLL